MSKLITKKLDKIFNKYNVSFAYLFGSQASGKTGPMSDYDFGVYFTGASEEDKKEIARKQLDIMSDLEDELKTEKVDVVPLNISPPGLSYNIVKNGKRIYNTDDMKRQNFEVRAMNEYFDFLPMILKNRKHIYSSIEKL